MWVLLGLVMNIRAAARKGDLVCHAEPRDRCDHLGLGAPEERIVDAQRSLEDLAKKRLEPLKGLRVGRPRRAFPAHCPPAVGLS